MNDPELLTTTTAPEDAPSAADAMRRDGYRHRRKSIGGGGQALAVADFLRAHPNANAVYLAQNSLDASHLYEEFAALAPEFSAAYLPDWDILPYENFSPTPAVCAQRIAVCAGRLSAPARLTIAPAVCALLPYAPADFYAARAFSLKVDDTLSVASITEYLQLGGYHRCPRVQNAGEYAIYGGQVDIFPPESESPFRLVLDDDRIEQIRLFDANTQRSTERVQSVNLLPAREFELSADSVKQFCQRFAAQFEASDDAVYPAVQDKTAPPGIEFYLPLFYESVGRLFDFMPDDPVVMINKDLPETLAAFFHQARLRQKVAGVYEGRAALPAHELFLSEADFFERLRGFRVVEWQPPEAKTEAPMVPANPRLQNPLSALVDFIRAYPGRVCIAVDNRARRDSLTVRLRENGLSPQTREQFSLNDDAELTLMTAPLRRGFILPAHKAHKAPNSTGLAVFSEYEIFQLQAPPRAQRQAVYNPDAININEIAEGDYVTHQEYGVGIARGLQNKKVDGKLGEYLELEYAEGQRLWLPVSQLFKLSRHHGETELSKMGGKAWKRAQERAEKNAYDAAARLLEVNARRAAKTGASHNPPSEMLDKFIGDFPYIETPDQEKTAAQVQADLLRKKAMDRLVCADVGFGKTEIAMRAAAIVAFAGRQVAMVAPTTLLAQQHYRIFTDRFADYPANIACLTRLAGGKERNETVAALATGQVDIVIGTHALLQKTIKFKDLGLAIIDEEHRFGVRHKELFKSMRANVDMLALSATPIPRSLAMALGGVRDMSLMSTPPLERLPIKTFVAPLTHGIVAEACERELRRGGQIFFIHNDIADIENMAGQLQQWLPDARIIIAHGQMPTGELESAMRKFLRRDADILLCTTIVESGLDITNANTIIITRADKMGISRLHQLRGRVGRGSAQAYAYFLMPGHGEVTKTAELRLSAAADYGVLGGGFNMSLRDLEIRGMGEILGERQSGDIETVGCERYQAMIKSAMRRIQNIDAGEDFDLSAMILMPQAALLPDDYIPAPNERIIYYRRLAACADDKAVDEVFHELTDRFGAAPDAAERLRESHYLRVAAGRVQAERVRISTEGYSSVKFAKSPSCAKKLLAKINNKECRPTSTTSIQLNTDSVDKIRAFLRALA